MSADGSIEIAWADGEDTFRLALAEIRILQEKTGFGPRKIMERLQDGSAFIDEWRETIRLGLIGGGQKPDIAMAKVKRSVDSRGWLESCVLAHAILAAAGAGAKDDTVGKGDAEEATMTGQAASPSPRSTATGRS